MHRQDVFVKDLPHHTLHDQGLGKKFQLEHGKDEQIKT